MALRKKCWDEYAVTLSPRIRHGDTELLYNQDRFMIRRILNRCTDHYLVYPEVDKQCRLHYHGVIKVKDKIKFHRKTRSALKGSFGFIKIEKLKTFRDKLQWLLYMRKDWGQLSELWIKPIIPRKRRLNLRRRSRKTSESYFSIREHLRSEVDD